MPYYQHFPRLFLGAPSPPRRLPPRVNGERGSGKGESKFRGSAGNCCARGQTSGMQRAAKGDSPAREEPVFGDGARGGPPGKVGGNIDNTAFNRSSTSARAQAEYLGEGRGAPGTRAGDSPRSSRC